MKTKTLFLLVAVFVSVYFLIFSEYSSRGVREGDKAPNFQAASRQGPVRLDHYQGKVVLLNFWATWCPPCRAEMPSLEVLHLKMEGKNFEILAVSEDEGGWKAIDDFLERMPLFMTILWDSDSSAASAYGTHHLPESFLIDRNGIVVKKYLGPREWDSEETLSEIMIYVDSP